MFSTSSGHVPFVTNWTFEIQGQECLFTCIWNKAEFLNVASSVCLQYFTSLLQKWEQQPSSPSAERELHRHACLVVCWCVFAAEGRLYVPFEPGTQQIGHQRRSAFVLTLLFICRESTVSMSSADLSLDRGCVCVCVCRQFDFDPIHEGTVTDSDVQTWAESFPFSDSSSPSGCIPNH